MRHEDEGESQRTRWRDRLFRWLLDDDAAWVLGDLEERTRKRRGVGRYARLIRDMASLIGWALLRRRTGKGEGMMRSGRAGGLFDAVRQDVRYTLTTLRRDLGFTTAVVLTLAIGIGANTAVFSIVQSVLLRPLPYADPDRLVMLWTSIPSRSIDDATSAYGNVRDWTEQNHVFEGFATYDPTTRTLTGGEYPEQVPTADVSANLFPLLGVAPALGRTFSPEEERTRAPVVVLNHDLWARRFSSSPGAVGRTVEIDGMPLEVIGVMPEGFAYPERNTQLWLPQTLLTSWDSRVGRRGTDSWRVLGRLAPDVSLESARREMADIATELDRDHPGENAGLGINVVPLRDQLTGYPLRLALWILYAAVGLVLLIACANAAHLVVARRVKRARELSLRSALGATRGRLIRLTLTETLVLSLLAAAAGVVLAAAGLDVLLSIAPSSIPRLGETRMSVPVLAYGIALSMFTAVLAAMGPRLGPSDTRLYEGLRGGRGSGHAIRDHRVRQLLVVAQFALAIALVFGSNLLTRSFVRTRSVDLGFDPANVLMANLRVESSSDRRAVYDQIVGRVSALPGVASASIVEDLFISGASNRTINVEGGHTAGPLTEELRIDAVAGQFFQTLNVPIREGRGFSDADDQTSAPVAVVNETMARRFWPGESAVGKRFRTEGTQWIEIVGVVGDMRRRGFERAPIAQAFRPYAQAPSGAMNLLVRTDTPVPGLPEAIRRIVADIDGSVPLYRVATVEEALGAYLVQRRFQVALLGLFSVVALVLAAVGIYGLVRYSMAQRTKELGIRIAVGAHSAQVVRMMVSQGLRLALVGLGVGAVLAAVLSRAISPLLFAVTPGDPASIVGTSLVLVCTAAVASYIPARRAARVDPVTALREA